jgi:hypothetical protein
VRLTTYPEAPTTPEAQEALELCIPPEGGMVSVRRKA